MSTLAASRRASPARLRGRCFARPRAVGASPIATPPPPAAPRPLAIAAPSEARLANGLRVIVARREGVPLVSAELVVLSGAEVDPPRLAGLASLSAGADDAGHPAPQRARSSPPPPRRSAARSTAAPAGTSRWSRSR